MYCPSFTIFEFSRSFLVGNAKLLK